jgi:phage gp16-like protein
MRPKLFHFQFAAGRVRFPWQRQQLHACGKSLGNVAENLARNFAVAALRFHHPGQRNELATCFRIANGTVPCLPFRR